MCTVDVRKKTCKLLRDKQFLLQSRLCIWTEVTHIKGQSRPKLRCPPNFGSMKTSTGSYEKYRMLKEFAPLAVCKRWGRNPHLQVNLSANLHNLCNGDIDHFSRWEKSSLHLGWNYSLIGTNGTYQRKWSLIAIPNHMYIRRSWISLACNFEDLKDRQTT